MVLAWEIWDLRVAVRFCVASYDLLVLTVAHVIVAHKEPVRFRHSSSGVLSLMEEPLASNQKGIGSSPIVSVLD